MNFKQSYNMLNSMVRNWWMVALRGLAAILFGLVAFFWNYMTLTTLVLLFGAYVLLDGVFTIATVVANDAGEHCWWMLLEGITGVISGVATFVWPNLTALVLLYLIATWAVVTGICEILAAIELRQEIQDEWFLALGGVASLIFGISVALVSDAGALAITWMIGLYSIVFGVLLLLLGFRLWDVNKRIDSRMSWDL